MRSSLVFLYICVKRRAPTNMKFALIFLWHMVYHLVVTEGDGYSFYKFSGPVSGQVQQIYVHNPHKHRQSVDYVAKPDYAYSFGVEDPHTGNSQARHESRNGDAVSGEYSVLQADGTVRVVRYTADPTSGFQATVHYKPISGHSR